MPKNSVRKYDEKMEKIEDCAKKEKGKTKRNSKYEACYRADPHSVMHGLDRRTRSSPYYSPTPRPQIPQLSNTLTIPISEQTRTAKCTDSNQVIRSRPSQDLLKKIAANMQNHLSCPNTDNALIIPSFVQTRKAQCTNWDTKVIRSRPSHLKENLYLNTKRPGRIRLIPQSGANVLGNRLASNR